MKKIEAKIVADSQWMGCRITTYLLTYPRFIHAELMTHRMFSRNSASSRAIPFEKMVAMCKEDPFIPIAWQKDHKGMQGTEYWSDPQEIKIKEDCWKTAALSAAKHAIFLNSPTGEGITKQLCNRLLEPFLWHTVIVTATEWENFFELRCPKYTWNDEPTYRSKKDMFKVHPDSNMDYATFEEWQLCNKSGAEIHIQALAEAMWDAKNESIPKELNSGEWHIPFGDQMDINKLATTLRMSSPENVELYAKGPREKWNNLLSTSKIKIATARCARLSYMTFDGEIDYAKDIALHDQLKTMKHFSPFEHCAKAMTADEYSKDFVKYESGKRDCGWCNNFKGFIPYRYIVENE